MDINGSNTRDCDLSYQSQWFTASNIRVLCNLPEFINLIQVSGPVEIYDTCSGNDELFFL